MPLTHQTEPPSWIEELSKESKMIKHLPAGPPGKLVFLGLEWLPAAQLQLHSLLFNKAFRGREQARWACPTHLAQVGPAPGMSRFCN